MTIPGRGRYEEDEPGGRRKPAGSGYAGYLVLLLGVLGGAVLLLLLAAGGGMGVAYLLLRTVGSSDEFSGCVEQMLVRDPAAVDGFKRFIAIRGWNDRLSPYAVIYGHFAARRAGNEQAAAQFLTDAGDKFGTAWPAPVLKFLRREIDDKALLAHARRGGEQTEAHCYVALDYALKDQKDQAITHFRWVIEHGELTFVEYRVALVELDRLELAPGGEGAREATQILGGAFDPQFTDAAPVGMLVGFDINLGKFANNDTIRAAQPIYRIRAVDRRGKPFGIVTIRAVTVVAKEGYAVGAITVKSGLVVDGMSITFMKTKDGQLDPNDAYESAWIGGKGGGDPVRLGAGVPVVGIVGKANNLDMTGLGLLLQKK